MPTRPPRPCPAARSTTTPRDWTPGPARQAHRTAADTPAEVPGHAATDRTGGDRAASRRRRGGAGGAAQPGAWAEAERTLLLYEFKAGLERYFSAHRAPLRSLAELIAFNRAHSKQELGLFGQKLLVAADATAGLADPAYIRARSDARRLAGPEGIDAALAAHQLDALVAPPPAWRGRSAAKATTSPASYSAAAVAGYPSLTVPMGQINGLPVGLLFMGTARANRS